MNNKFDELAKGLAKSVARRETFKKFGGGLGTAEKLDASRERQVGFSSSVAVAIGSSATGGKSIPCSTGVSIF